MEKSRRTQKSSNKDEVADKIEIEEEDDEDNEEDDDDVDDDNNNEVDDDDNDDADDDDDDNDDDNNDNNDDNNESDDDDRTDESEDESIEESEGDDEDDDAENDDEKEEEKEEDDDEKEGDDEKEEEEKEGDDEDDDDDDDDDDDEEDDDDDDDSDSSNIKLKKKLRSTSDKNKISRSSSKSNSKSSSSKKSRSNNKSKRDEEIEEDHDAIDKTSHKASSVNSTGSDVSDRSNSPKAKCTVSLQGQSPRDKDRDKDISTSGGVVANTEESEEIPVGIATDNLEKGDNEIGGDANKTREESGERTGKAIVRRKKRGISTGNSEKETKKSRSSSFQSIQSTEDGVSGTVGRRKVSQSKDEAKVCENGDDKAAELSQEYDSRGAKLSPHAITTKLLNRLMTDDPLSVSDLSKLIPETTKDNIQSILEVLQVMGIVIAVKLRDQSPAPSSAAALESQALHAAGGSAADENVVSNTPLNSDSSINLGGISSRANSNSKSNSNSDGILTKRGTPSAPCSPIATTRGNIISGSNSSCSSNNIDNIGSTVIHDSKVIHDLSNSLAASTTIGTAQNDILSSPKNNGTSSITPSSNVYGNFSDSNSNDSIIHPNTINSSEDVSGNNNSSSSNSTSTSYPSIPLAPPVMYYTMVGFAKGIEPLDFRRLHEQIQEKQKQTEAIHERIRILQDIATRPMSRADKLNLLRNTLESTYTLDGLKLIKYDVLYRVFYDQIVKASSLSTSKWG